jgi:hypothetical protein
MNTHQSRIILPALLAVSVGVFSQAAAATSSLSNPGQPAVEATTNAPQPQQSAQPNAKPTPWWWEWLRYAGGGR